MSKWDERFNTPEYVYGKDPNNFLQENYSSIPLGSVLSLCEGEGRNAVFLAKKGYDVTAVDSSKIGLAKALRLADENGVNIKTIKCDLTDFEITPGNWDGIVSVFCHTPPDFRKTLHNMCAKGLKQNGVLILEGYSERQLDYRTGGPTDPDLLLKLDQVKLELKGLDFRIAREIVRDINEGMLHKGHGAVVQILAVKK